MPKRPLQRPRISAPFGPVKSSRGSDLIRSDQFELVHSIKDCTLVSATPSASVASRRSRRISACFPNTEPPTTSPIVGESEVNVVAHTKVKKTPKGSFGKKNALLSLSTRSLLKQPSVYTLVAQPSSLEDGENIPPLEMKDDDRGKKSSLIPRVGSKLPKSRTMTVLHGLKKSFSRSSLAAARNSGFMHKASPRGSPGLPQVDDTETSNSTLSSSVATSSSSSGIGSSPSPPIPERDATRIYTAQSSEYWSGRFMALDDRFSAENLQKPSLSSSSSNVHDYWQDYRLAAARNRQSLTTSSNRLTYLAPSNTTSALTTITHNTKTRPDNEDEVKYRRIFSHLDSLCITSEAKQSLQLWQQAYARHLGRPKLLPKRGSMDDKGPKNKLLGSAGNRYKSCERQGPTLKELPNPRAAAGGIAVNLAPSRGVAAC
ncbi:hypothetical protein QQS21_004423 [Conoideocrella luteorostrata]|uniref:Uncharacterized protein n=1 Tax=Conoideocrella luteorostrata TaxID=1105319 RepID=A0AAJ0G1K5_9HYPO|nr:hypothetical protein QQS21_004423 [Conoideocrella luteorostrata]